MLLVRRSRRAAASILPSTSLYTYCNATKTNSFPYGSPARALIRAFNPPAQCCRIVPQPGVRCTASRTSPLLPRGTRHNTAREDGETAFAVQVGRAAPVPDRFNRERRLHRPLQDPLICLGSVVACAYCAASSLL